MREKKKRFAHFYTAQTSVSQNFSKISSIRCRTGRAAAKLYTTVYVLFGAAIAAMAILQVVNHIRVYIMTHPQFGEDNSLFPDKAANAFTAS